MQQTETTASRSDDEVLLRRIERYLRKDAGPDGCFHWQGYINRRRNRLRAWVRGMSRPVQLELLRMAGRIAPEGYAWRRQCASEDCVRPEHYSAISRTELLASLPRRPLAAACIHGHPFTPENTKATADGRRCRQCRRDADKRYYARRHPRRTDVLASEPSAIA